ncbi:MAG: homoserine O-succinyltransferase [Alphaproteobacteria bacterium]|nr:homoserine O-succinyltransferase [Alphaproteobacteria bacterium]MDA7982581.1 homoserine O-succinyltransferase [Alphaproteobacteria bacterium]MDA8000548.1 homoserine O-succinyltransferase [Alphaproteobacteria bacterium]MDA8004359.1 homoserine O-succinyltransferase [Alphaproteobacteria bacterium]MDA8005243.1 homoserine O-succinyltransferase [Alphaproteobacteria bacterium]
MPIKIPNDLPGRKVLEAEGVSVIKETDATRQDIRPLQIALLNLMPDKIRTETQFARLTGATPLQVELTLLRTGSYRSRNVSERHLLDFYRCWEDVSAEKFDGFIVTGAPVETMEFEEVAYWDELRRIIDWSERNVHESMFICWGAQSALYHRYGVPKHGLGEKLFGVYRQRLCRRGVPLLTGMNDEFSIPVSRYTEVRAEDLPAGLDVLATSEESGLCMVEDVSRRSVYMFNHVEYDAGTLRDEYERDLANGAGVSLPVDYFPGDDPGEEPINRWRVHAHLLFSNWINRMYQGTPFAREDIGR